MEVHITESPLVSKKYRIKFPNGKTVDFGGDGYSDYTLHKDVDRQINYLKRHKKRENWSKDGIYTAGFWSRWMLWNRPSITQSINDIKKRFNVTIIKKR